MVTLKHVKLVLPKIFGIVDAPNAKVEVNMQ